MFASVVTVIPVPLTKVNTASAESATTLVCPVTEIVLKFLKAVIELSTYALFAASVFAVGVVTVTVLLVNVNTSAISDPVILKSGSIEIFLILVSAIDYSLRCLINLYVFT